MKKTILATTLALTMVVPVAHASEASEKENYNIDTKLVSVSLNSISSESLFASTTPSLRSVLSKDAAYSNGATGTITSTGQYVDLSKIIPEGSEIKGITIYCPTTTKVTQSTYTTIDNYLIKHPEKDDAASVKFQKTNSPRTSNKTTALNNLSAGTKLFVQLEGNVLRQASGLDGFTVMGGEMIIEYQ